MGDFQPGAAYLARKHLLQTLRSAVVGATGYAAGRVRDYVVDESVSKVLKLASPDKESRPLVATTFSAQKKPRIRFPLHDQSFRNHAIQAYLQEKASRRFYKKNRKGKSRRRKARREFKS